MGETKRDRIVRVAAQDRFPQGNGTIELAIGPRGERGDVVELSLRRARGKRMRGARFLDRDRNERLLEGEHREIALHAVRQREVGIGPQHGVETIRRIGSIGEVARDEMVEGCGSRCARCRDGKTARIEMHGVAPVLHTRRLSYFRFAADGILCINPQ
jgi:hypothetical protein